MSTPEISVVIPIHNEEAILRSAVVDLREQLSVAGLNCEIILCENGSTDATLSMAHALQERYREVRVCSVPEPNYGRALRAGLATARGRWVCCDEVDICDVDFHQRALRLLADGAADMVIGSKLAGGASDERPWPRHVASQLYTALLRWLVGFEGTDTHGIKAMRRELIAPVAEACVVDRDVFASEFVIRAYRAGFTVVEVPVRIKEKRPPSINLLRRVPQVLKNLLHLTWAVRIVGPSGARPRKP